MASRDAFESFQLTSLNFKLSPSLLTGSPRISILLADIIIRKVSIWGLARHSIMDCYPTQRTPEDYHTRVSSDKLHMNIRRDIIILRLASLRNRGWQSFAEFGKQDITRDLSVFGLDTNPTRCTSKGSGNKSTAKSYTKYDA
jgi:hypothetical protein